MGSQCCKKDDDFVNIACSEPTDATKQNGSAASADPQANGEAETNLTTDRDQPAPDPSTNKPAPDLSTSTTQEAGPATQITHEDATEPDHDQVTLKAIFDYTARETDDLDFLKGDKLLLVQGGDDPGWWQAKHLATGHIGYVPSTYVVQDNNSTEAQEWWFNMIRAEANKQLTLPGNPNGTFLVRESSEKNTFALSVRLFDSKRPSAQGIKHYKIRFKDDGKRCFVNAKNTFTTVTKLIEYYKETIGLCCKLLKACPKTPEAVPFKELEIDRESIRLLDKIGQGNFGEVWKAKWRNQVEVAVKTLKPKSMLPSAFLEEAEIMHKLQHRKLVQLMGVCTKEEPMYIITELMVNGSLRDYLRTEGKDKIEFMTLIEIAAQIADGMSYLEEKNFIHRDVRTANMLVGENNTTKVADFGLARVIEDDEYTATGAKFPVKWTAPEAIHRRIFSTRSDVWSFGVLLYELVTYGRNPYPGMTNQDVIEKIETGYRMPKPESFECPQDIYDIMKKCWNDDADKRPTFKELFTFFDKYAIPVYEDDRFEGVQNECEVEEEGNRYES